jgi:hypothetical protein
MKRVCLFVCISVSLFVFVSASIWEGATTTSDELPNTGLYLATNSFPINTVVDVINLENGNISRLIVYSGLDSAGFLGLLSREAAAALGIPDRALGRIRMNQVSDILALSRFTEGRISQRDHDSLELSLVPAENRSPEDTVSPDPSHFISPVGQAAAPVLSGIIDPSLVIPSVNADRLPPSAMVAPQSTFSVPSQSIFSAPLTRSLERGLYYVQLAAFGNADAVNPEISRIDNRLPVLVMDAGTAQTPLYRVLIGPLSLGEAGAIVQRFRSTHSDAFVRVGH